MIEPSSNLTHLWFSRVHSNNPKSFDEVLPVYCSRRADGDRSISFKDYHALPDRLDDITREEVKRALGWRFDAVTDVLVVPYRIAFEKMDDPARYAEWVEVKTRFVAHYRDLPGRNRYRDDKEASQLNSRLLSRFHERLSSLYPGVECELGANHAFRPERDKKLIFRLTLRIPGKMIPDDPTD